MLLISHVFGILKTVQGKCKANAEPSSLELCWAAAFTRTRNFMIASTKVVKFIELCKHLNNLIALINTYDDL